MLIGCIDADIRCVNASAEVNISGGSDTEVSIGCIPQSYFSIWPSDCKSILVGIETNPLADIDVECATKGMECTIALVCTTDIGSGFFLYVEEGRVVIEEGYAKIYENIY